MATPKKTTTVTLDMQVGDATFLKIAKLAHSHDCTFNEMVNKLLVDAVERQTVVPVNAPVTPVR
jgi:hypothetical protein